MDCEGMRVPSLGSASQAAAHPKDEEDRRRICAAVEGVDDGGQLLIYIYI